MTSRLEARDAGPALAARAGYRSARPGSAIDGGASGIRDARGRTVSGRLPAPGEEGVPRNSHTWGSFGGKELTVAVAGGLLPCLWRRAARVSGGRPDPPEIFIAVVGFGAVLLVGYRWSLWRRPRHLPPVQRYREGIGDAVLLVAGLLHEMWRNRPVPAARHAAAGCSGPAAARNRDFTA